MSPLLAHSGREPGALHMPAFGVKADMTFCGNPLLRSLLGVKRTSLFAAQMSANDPKRAPARTLQCIRTLERLFA
jgi:hypothetical protein